MKLHVEDLAARRGEDLIFQHISLVLQAGEGLVVTGANGSGKSTFLRVLSGLLPVDAGRVRLEGAGSDNLAESSHYLGHRNAMKRELTVSENLVFWQDFMGDSPGGRGLPVEVAIDALGLSGIGHLPFGYLSAGQQRRMAMARLLVAFRPVWLLDEPTAALDASADRMFAGLVRGHLEQGGIVVAATHQPLGIDGVRELRMTGFAGVFAEAGY
ncbi:cytochrome C biogenesis protein [Pararhizobium antarcticum]|uniref:Cytochrome C biogenesis protein n=1 Tax=Pararhizobium antarcticum TaxID=1798805 RepID=A0A657LXX9_9HYPH|nr:heme ABC exporter ATP-binding protein CcmA [Pararhizobium antarcticum]OJF89874.1 cytochrome C biogenesis protein [Rhizobium sp. 58]OJF99821.1 cytochrome C biogenesis protein [Pararhizobium antarcticum]